MPIETITPDTQTARHDTTADVSLGLTPLAPDHYSNPGDEVVIYRDQHLEVVRRGPATPGQAIADYDVTTRRPPYPSVGCVHFQHDTVLNVGIVGMTNERLLAMVIDRLRCFRSGPFACDENATALSLLELALEDLLLRPARRTARGVEGTHAP